MACCANCFGDRYLTEHIAALSSLKGDCPYCLSKGVDLIEPKLLVSNFSILISIYEPDASGKPLVEWLKSDWNLFNNERMNGERVAGLLAEILGDAKIVEQQFSPSTKYQGRAALNLWEQLCDELMYKNRYFLSSQLDLDWIGELLELLPALDVPGIWYRARIQTGEKKFTIGEMEAPPKRLATHGRANPSGIPYLYVSSTQNVAVSEVRPHVGDLVCVAPVEISAGTGFVDLCNPRKLITPFPLDDEDKIGLLRVDIPFLERLGEELTRPVSPQGAAIDYVPSQYLCEFIKSRRKAGVIYRSSVGDGRNLALFDPGQATFVDVEQFRVTRVSADIQKVDS